MGSLCSKIRRLRGGDRPRYKTLGSDSSGTNSSTPSQEESPDKDVSSNTGPPSPWTEAAELSELSTRSLASNSHNGNEKSDDKLYAEHQFSKIAKQLKQLHQPILIQQNAIINSHLLFKMALGLSQEATFAACFGRLKEHFLPNDIEVMMAADGPHKLKVKPAAWEKMSDSMQAAVKHFNALVSSCHKYLGSKELKIVDIQLKLDDLHLLLSLLPEKQEEYDTLSQIPESVNELSRHVETLFRDITSASKLLDYHVMENGGNIVC